MSCKRSCARELPAQSGASGLDSQSDGKQRRWDSDVKDRNRADGAG